MSISLSRTEQLHSVGQIERITMPMEKRNSVEVAKWRRRIDEAQRVKADFLDRPFVNRRAKCRRYHLCAKAYAERRQASLEPPGKATQLA